MIFSLNSIEDDLKATHLSVTLIGERPDHEAQRVVRSHLSKMPTSSVVDHLLNFPSAASTKLVCNSFLVVEIF